MKFVRFLPILAAAATIGGIPVVATAHSPQQPTAKRPTIEVAFVLDTTGSMSNLIEGAKRKIWSIASRIAQGKPTPVVRVGLIGYRDRGDQYVTKRYDLTDNLDAVYENLQRFSAAGGGDTPEHVGRALGEAVKQFSWSQDRKTLKMIFVVGDAPPQTYGDGWNYKSWAKKAIASDIVVNTVRCGPDEQTRKAFQAIAHLADGSFTTISGSGGMVATKTPYDDELARLNRELAETRVYSGSAERRAKAKVVEKALAEMDAEASADRTAYSLATKGAAAPAPSVAGTVDVVTMNSSEVKRLKADQLPASMRKLSKAQRAKKIATLKAKRKTIESKLGKLAKKRATWRKKNVRESSTSFDDVVMKEVRTKAAAIDVEY